MFCLVFLVVFISEVRTELIQLEAEDGFYTGMKKLRSAASGQATIHLSTSQSVINNFTTQSSCLLKPGSHEQRKHKLENKALMHQRQKERIFPLNLLLFFFTLTLGVLHLCLRLCQNLCRTLHCISLFHLLS